MKDLPGTIVLYEAPHRIERTLEELREALGEREVALVREMTKLHEEVIRGKISEVLKRIKGKAKGEFTVVLAGEKGMEIR